MEENCKPESMALDENSSSNSDAEMYTSGKTQSMNLADVDSGIEGMEVDEKESKIELKWRREANEGSETTEHSAREMKKVNKPVKVSKEI